MTEHTSGIARIVPTSILDRLAGEGIYLEIDDGVSDFLSRRQLAEDQQPPLADAAGSPPD